MTGRARSLMASLTMAIWSVVMALAVGGSSVASTPPALSAGAQLQRFVADGNRVSVDDRGFSIVPPRGWEVTLGHPTTSFLAQILPERGLVYQRTIQVNVGQGGIPIDEKTAVEFESEIVRRFTSSTVAATGFRIRNHQIVSLPDGQKGVMYYTEFVITGTEMMQLHLLRSGEKKHYLASFTDLAKNFEAGSSSPELSVAWESLTSIELDSVAPGRFSTLSRLLLTVVGIALLLVFVGIVRSFIAKWRYARVASDESAYDSDLQVSHAASPANQSSMISANVTFNSKTHGDDDIAEENLDSRFSDSPVKKDRWKVS